MSEYARTVAEHTAPPLLRSWLAASGARGDSLRAFDTAGRLLPANLVDAALPFLFLGGAHLDRRRGNALIRLGEAVVIDQRPALAAYELHLGQGMLVDLACAFAAAGDRDAALDYARQAKRLATQVESDRQTRRLNGLILPAGVRRSA